MEQEIAILDKKLDEILLQIGSKSRRTHKKLVDAIGTTVLCIDRTSKLVDFESLTCLVGG